MKEFSLTAQMRDNAGVKGKLSQMRKSGLIPAVIYGASKTPAHVSVSEKELLVILKGGRNAIIKIKYGSAQEDVLLKEIQKHVVTGRIIHLDFHRISLTDKVEVKVPLKFTGEAYGVKTQGGIIEHNLREINIKCLPADLPKELVVDITALHIGNSIRVKDLKYDKIEIKEDLEHIIASVIAAKEEEVATPAAAQAEAGKEPELVATKGKKEEEGEAAAEAKPEAKKEEKKAEPKK